MALTDSTDDNLPVLEPGLVFKIVVPRDRIELSTPGFSVERTDVLRGPLRSTIVFMPPRQARCRPPASTTVHGRRCQVRCHFGGPPQGGAPATASGKPATWSRGICPLLRVIGH
jgi:hypothetical protein